MNAIQNYYHCKNINHYIQNAVIQIVRVMASYYYLATDLRHYAQSYYFNALQFFEALYMQN